MPRAFCLIRSQPHYRHDAFHSGLKACGYDVRTEYPRDIKPDDMLVIWNRYGQKDEYARQFEAAGAKVLIAENGYVGSDKDGHQLYALSRNFHNGGGSWHIGDEPRWKSQNIELKPWRDGGEEIIVLPQRGFGASEISQPQDWAETTATAIRRKTSRPVRVRNHPGNHPPAIPLEQDLENAWAVVVWASSAGIKALAHGVPVFYSVSQVDWRGCGPLRFG